MPSRNKLHRLGALVFTALGCAVTQGPSPYRRDEQAFQRVDDLEQPGGLFTIVPARSSTVKCPACGAENTLGVLRCVACDGLISTRPISKACESCQGLGKTPKGKCKECGGTGYVEEPAK